jgi:23S rRNA (guanosine2251-2'-O)-methyltransferase
VHELHVDATRRDARMKQFVARAQEAGAKRVDSDDARLTRWPAPRVTRAWWRGCSRWRSRHALDDLLDGLQGPPLLLVLDGVTDPHNLGACLRVADGAGAHAVVAPKDHAVGLGATVAKVASGAAETVPYLMVTNLARTLGETEGTRHPRHRHQRRRPQTLYHGHPDRPGGAGAGRRGQRGMRQLTRKHLRPAGAHSDGRGGGKPERLVASGVCLYEAVRQRNG